MLSGLLQGESVMSQSCYKSGFEQWSASTLLPPPPPRQQQTDPKQKANLASITVQRRADYLKRLLQFFILYNYQPFYIGKITNWYSSKSFAILTFFYYGVKLHILYSIATWPPINGWLTQMYTVMFRYHTFTWESLIGLRLYVLSSVLTMTD